MADIADSYMLEGAYTTTVPKQPIGSLGTIGPMNQQERMSTGIFLELD